jgi:epoxyqueuosine reductase QueG
MGINKLIENTLTSKGADIVRFVDISELPDKQTQGFQKAIIFCEALSKEFIMALYGGAEVRTDGIEAYGVAEIEFDEIAGENNGAETGREEKRYIHDEFVEKEHRCDAIADELAAFIKGEGFRTFSQSEESLLENGFYDETTHTTLLPHKTIGRLAGLGFIGKNDLLINEDYGCAFCKCTVLTDAPIETMNYPLVSSKCGSCEICREVCPYSVIFGNEWSETTGRGGLVDIFKCYCALKCVVYCPYTLKYAICYFTMTFTLTIVGFDFCTSLPFLSLVYSGPLNDPSGFFS